MSGPPCVGSPSPIVLGKELLQGLCEPSVVNGGVDVADLSVLKESMFWRIRGS